MILANTLDKITTNFTKTHTGKLRMKFLICIFMYLFIPATILYVGAVYNIRFLQMYSICHFIWAMGVCVFYIGVKFAEQYALGGAHDAYLPPTEGIEIRDEKEADFFLGTYQYLFIVTIILSVTLCM